MLHFSAKGTGVIYVNLPEGFMANQMHIVPNAIYNTHYSVSANLSDGSSTMVHEGLTMTDKNIQWTVPEDAVSLVITMDCAQQGGMIGGFVEDAEPIVVEEGDIPSSWREVNAPTSGYISSEEDRNTLIERYEDLGHHFTVNMNNPLLVRTDDPAVLELMYIQHPEWRDLSPSEIIANSVPDNLSPHDYAEMVSYQTNLLIGQHGDAYNAARDILVNQNDNTGIELQHALTVSTNRSIHDAKNKFDDDMESLTFRNSLGMVFSQNVSNPNYHPVDVAAMYQEELDAIRDHFQTLIDQANGLVIADGGDVLPPAGDALTEFMDSLPEDLRELFMSLNNEQREALYATLNNKSFLAGVGIGDSNVMVASEGGEIAATSGIDMGEAYEAVGVNVSEVDSNGDVRFIWGNVELDRVNLYAIMEGNTSGKILQSNLPEAGSYIASNSSLGKLDDGTYRLVLTGIGGNVVGVSNNTFIVGDGVDSSNNNVSIDEVFTEGNPSDGVDDSGVSDDGLYVTDGGDDETDDGGDPTETSRGMTVETQAFFDKLPQVSQDAFLAVYDGGTWLERDATDEELKVGRVLVENAGSDIALAIGIAYADSPTEVAAFAEVAVNTYILSTDVVNEDNESSVEHGAGDGNLSWEGVFGWLEDTSPEHITNDSQAAYQGIMTTIEVASQDNNSTISNPLKQLEADELEGEFTVMLQSHNVEFAKMDSKFDHLSLLIIPQNQEHYMNNTMFGHSNGQIAFSIGGNWGSSLTAAFNRSSDMKDHHQNRMIQLEMPDKYLSTAEWVTDLYNSTINFQEESAARKIDYDLFASNNPDMLGRYNGHNSNSFITGLLIATSTSIPPIENLLEGQRHSGWDRPVPLEYYRNDI
ncbi:hypothetical protein HOC51_01575 [Candidatus Peribacteria bacterium]|nr:hypothetical protein [Candidatus Peribacteria bacterium]